MAVLAKYANLAHLSLASLVKRSGSHLDLLELLFVVEDSATCLAASFQIHGSCVAFALFINDGSRAYPSSSTLSFRKEISSHLLIHFLQADEVPDNILSSEKLLINQFLSETPGKVPTAPAFIRDFIDSRLAHYVPC